MSRSKIKFLPGDRVVVTKPHTAWTGMTGVIMSATLVRTKDGLPGRYSIKMDGTILAKNACYNTDELAHACAIKRLADLP